MGRWGGEGRGWRHTPYPERGAGAKKRPSSYVIDVPDEIDVKALRRKLKLSQAAGASSIG